MSPPSLFRLILILLVCLVAAPRQAEAHANLLATVPTDGSVLDVAPQALILRFDEKVTPIAVTLQDAQSHVLPLGAISTVNDGKEVRIALPAPLPQGGYRVVWRMLSIDGHPLGSIYVFRVGAGPAVSKLLGVEDGWRAMRILLRAIRDLTLLLAAGAGAFAVLLGPTGRKPIRIAALVGIFAVLLDFLLLNLEVGFRPDFVWEPLLVTLGLVLILTGKGRIPVIGALVAAAGLVFASHVGVKGLPAQIALWIHVLAVAFWLGALWPLWTMLRRPQQAGATVERFSQMAMAAVCILVLSGLFLAVTQLGPFAGLFTSTYGLLLLTKITLVTVVLGLAALNKYLWTPRLETATAAFRKSIDIELAVMTLIVVVTAVLAESPTP